MEGNEINTKSDLIKDSEEDHAEPSITETELSLLLRSLPVALTITKRRQGYMWQWYEGKGTEASYKAALHMALNYILVTYVLQ